MKEVFVIKDCISCFYYRRINTEDKDGICASNHTVDAILPQATEFDSYQEAVNLIRFLGQGSYQIEKIFKVG